MSRDSYFDNYKALLIILVVIGHFIAPFMSDSHLMYFIHTIIFSFHMPAFIFISGYFSKRNNMLKLVKTILIPYTVFQIIYYILINYAWDQETKFQFFEPQFSLWFLLSLFCWRILINNVIKIKWILPILLIIGIFVGYDTSIGAFGAVRRTISFFPYFILGYIFDKDRFMKIADKTFAKICSYLLIFGTFGFLFFRCEHIPSSILTMQFSYQKDHVLQWGWLYRILVYILAILLIYLIATIIPRKQYWFSYLGQRTMSIYLLHGIIYKFLLYKTDIYKTIDSTEEMIIFTILTIVLAFLLSLKPFDYCISKISAIPVEKLLISNKEN